MWDFRTDRSSRLGIAESSIARGHFDANGQVTPHKTRNLYIVFVVRGSGRLVLFGEDQHSTEIDFKAGDVVVLPPGTLHQWRNGGEPFDFVGVESSAPTDKGEATKETTQAEEEHPWDLSRRKKKWRAFGRS